jgi:hypothetical protein
VLGKCLSPSNQPATDADRIQLAQVLAEIANHLPSDDTVPFNDLDQLLAWTGQLLVALHKDTPPETVQAVLWKISGPVLRIRAWRRIENSIDHAYRSEKPSWYEKATATLVDESIADFLNHLKQGDDAATGSGVGYQVHFILRHRAEQLRAAVRELLDSKDVDLSILASRLVSARTITGIKPDWKLTADFDQETFNQVAPPGGDPWYEEPIQDVDVRDLSWANRRKFATGRVSPPIPTT